MAGRSGWICFLNKGISLSRFPFDMIKNNDLMTILALAVGIAVGWFSRGAVGSADGNNKVVDGSRPKVAITSPSTADKEPAPSPGPIKRTIREAAPKKSDEASGTMIHLSAAQIQEMQKQQIKALTERQRAKLQQRIDKLAETVPLTAAQKAHLMTWLDERVGKAESMSAKDMATPGAEGELMKSMSSKALDDQLSNSLTDDQKTALADFNSHENQTKTDSAALKSLSLLQGSIDLEEGQRDAVYKILSAAAAARLQKESNNPSSSGMSIGGTEIDMDPYGLGIQDAMQQAFIAAGGDASGNPPDRQKMADTFSTLINQQIDNQVDQLRPVLNDKQLEQYRSELEKKGVGIVGRALMGGSGGGTGGGISIEFPGN